jgi:hypothetical protein
MSENQNLKLILDFVIGQILCRSKMSAAGIVNEHVKVTGLAERIMECLRDGLVIREIECNWVKPV